LEGISRTVAKIRENGKIVLPRPWNNRCTLNLGTFFLEHPRSVGQTYWQHMRTALSFAWRLAIAMVCVAVHALVPGLFPRTASGIVSNLHRCMSTRETAHDKPHQ
jgi:hypothetical protein